MSSSIVKPRKVANHVRRHPQIKNVIAVASGKGGVGKSTLAVNYALMLQRTGASVGLLDADIYGPSQPFLLNMSSEMKPQSPDGKSLQPFMRFGLQTMSIGYLVAQDAAMVWRGPMVSGALVQLFSQTLWQDLDYLIIDLPPGTGDIQLTLAQKIPVTGVVLITTPHVLACLDVEKAYQMFQKVGIPVLGMVENMSSYTCTGCGHESHPFGSNGALALAEKYQIPILGRLPLSDEASVVLTDPASAMMPLYAQWVEQSIAALSALKADYAVVLPGVVVENKNIDP
jgi:ATP-binding protein involved in chromosome partitioning